MKTRESDMPDEQTWNSFFDPDSILNSLGIRAIGGTIVDLGCGYGTFTIPAARRTKGLVCAIDIEKEMVNITQKKVRQHGFTNVVAVQRDFFAEGTGLADDSCDYVMLFNILHAEEPLRILAEARRILAAGGRVGIIHWIDNPSTPRGPTMSIRPRPEQCQSWLTESGFSLEGTIVALPPFHYGLVGRKP